MLAFVSAVLRPNTADLWISTRAESPELTIADGSKRKKTCNQFGRSDRAAFVDYEWEELNGFVFLSCILEVLKSIKIMVTCVTGRRRSNINPLAAELQAQESSQLLQLL
jgi:hypothetical protein